jgi:prevent-host-death family protein
VKIGAANEAKTHLSALLQAVNRGETIVIARGRKPLAKLVPYDPPERERPKVGETLDAEMTVPKEPLAPLSEKELQAWGLR